MICYKGKTFCNYHIVCSAVNDDCDILTDKEKENAFELDIPICYYTDFPKCFVPFFMGIK